MEAEGPFLFQESEDRTRWSAPKASELPLLRDNYAAWAGKKLFPVLHPHPLQTLPDAIDKMAKLPVDRVEYLVDARDVRRAMMGIKERELPLKGRWVDGKLLVQVAEPDKPLPDPLPTEVAHDLGAVATLSQLPVEKRSTARRPVYLLRRMELPDGTGLLVRNVLTLAEERSGSVVPVAGWANHGSTFSRWEELWADMHLSGAERALLIFHRRGSFVRFEEHSAATAADMVGPERVAFFLDQLAASLRTVRQQTAPP